VAVAVAVAALLGTTACGGAPSKTEFADHGVEITTVATTKESKSMWHSRYECAFDKLKEDESTITAFMDVQPEDTVPAGLSDKISKALGECVTAEITAGAGAGAGARAGSTTLPTASPEMSSTTAPA
jgi:hypothetical protein